MVLIIRIASRLLFNMLAVPVQSSAMIFALMIKLCFLALSVEILGLSGFSRFIVHDVE
jgi:hypothetical protein